MREQTFTSKEKEKRLASRSFIVWKHDDEAPRYQFNATLTMWFLFSSLFHFIYVFKDKLKSENSKVLDNWPSLIEKLQSGRDLARENAEYLSTLQEYFVVSIIDNNFSLLFVSLLWTADGQSSRLFALPKEKLKLR